MGARQIYSVLEVLLAERHSQESSQPMSKNPLHLGQRMLLARCSKRARVRQLGHTP